MPEVQRGAAVLKLTMKIETLRIRLIQQAEQLGLNDPKVIRLSQRLDELINEAMKQSA